MEREARKEIDERTKNVEREWWKPGEWRDLRKRIPKGG